MCQCFLGARVRVRDVNRAGGEASPDGAQPSGAWVGTQRGYRTEAQEGARLLPHWSRSAGQDTDQPHPRASLSSP